jgi:hypothetical protein
LATPKGPVAREHDRECAPGPRADLAGGEDGRPGCEGDRSGGEGERISQGLADVLVHRLFAVGLDLHSALTCIEAGIGGDVTVEKIHRAINGLDGAIRDFRGVVFDLHPSSGTDARPGLRALILEAVERACAPAALPAVTFGRGLEAVADQTVWQQVARLVHQALTLVPGDRLSKAHVVVAADPRPPRLVMHIDAPARDLAGVAGRLRALETCDMEGVDLDRMDVWCQDLPRSPERSRIRLEWRMAS